MTQEVENELLKLDDRYPHAAARFPPSVRVKAGVACGLNRHPDRLAFQGTIQHPLGSPRVVLGGYEHDGSDVVLGGPRWQNVAFAFGSNIDAGDLHDVGHAERPQLPNLSCARILVRKPAADEFVILSARRIHKDGDPLCNPGLDQVRRFERAGAAGVGRYDDDVGGG